MQKPIFSYTDQGKGKTIVFIHGFCETKDLWKDYISYLKDKYRIICPDLPGFGENLIATKGISIELMADHIHALLVQLKIDRCVMIGHSLGGYVTLAFAEKYSHLLDGIVLFHSNAFADTPEKKENRTKSIQHVTQYGVEPFTNVLIPNLFSKKSQLNFPNEIRELCSTAALTNKNTVVDVTTAMRDRKNRIEVLMNIKIPVLFIVGKEDTVIPIEVTVAQSYLPDISTIHYLAGVGHMGMIEAKELTLCMIDNFMRQIRETTGINE